VSGDRPPIIVSAERDTVLARAVEALGRFPTEQAWVLIGGVAVFLRLGSITRPTADADTLARSQAELIEQLIGDRVATVVTSGEVRVPIGDGLVAVDVMDLADEPLAAPSDVERRTFALARRCALATAETERVLVVDRHQAPVVEAEIPVATIAALSALKTVSMVRRPHGRHPQKVGSDIHDLVRLVASGPQGIAEQLASFDVELAGWVASTIGRAFGDDLRYTLLRLRNNDGSAGARALIDDDIAATVILADLVHERLADQ